MIVFANSASIGTSVAVQICMMMKMNEKGVYMHNKLHFEYIVLCLFGVLLLAVCLVPAVLKVVNEQTYVVTVQSKERVVIGTNDSKYLVYTTDSNGESYVFEITDSLFRLRFDSADTYNLIQVGETYAFTACGYRVPIFSMYPNIYMRFILLMLAIVRQICQGHKMSTDCYIPIT